MSKNSRTLGISWDVQFSTLAKTPGGGAHLLLGGPEKRGESDTEAE